MFETNKNKRTKWTSHLLGGLRGWRKKDRLIAKNPCITSSFSIRLKKKQAFHHRFRHVVSVVDGWLDLYHSGYSFILWIQKLYYIVYSESIHGYWNFTGSDSLNMQLFFFFCFWQDKSCKSLLTKVIKKKKKIPGKYKEKPKIQRAILPTTTSN
jgi:hypothetical protein